MIKTLKEILNNFPVVHNGQSNPSGAMKHLTVSEAATKARKAGGIPLKMWGPLKPFPNVKDFRVEVSKLDELFAKFGIQKRAEKARLEYVPYRNRDLNRYIAHQLIRLHKSTPENYWKLSTILLKRSRIWFMMSLRHVFPRWHREFPYWFVLKLRRDYLKLIKDFDTGIRLDYRRVYIEKANKRGWRPLGVPKPVFRILLNSINNMLVLCLDPWLKDEQHGFRPKRGTLTAWKQILTTVINKQYIYEYDLEKYFDKINLNYVETTLSRFRVSRTWINLINVMNRSIINLPKNRLIDETSQKNMFPGNQQHYWAQAKPGGPFNITIPPVLGQVLIKEEGVPQGAPFSPFISNLVLDISLLAACRLNAIKVVQYADDGIMCSDQEFKFPWTLEIKRAGIIQSLEKSGWVKFNGEWLKPLKFLGLEFDGNKSELSANTRKGSKLLYDKDSLLELIEERGDSSRFEKLLNIVELDESGWIQSASIVRKSEATWERFVKSKYAGWIQSRLYNGSWNLEGFKQDFSLTFAEGSWVSEYVKWSKKWDYAQKEKWSWVKTAEWITGTKLASPALYQESLKLNVFNSTSVATRSILEAFRLAEGMSPRKALRQLKLDPVIQDKETGQPIKPRGNNLEWASYNKYQKMNIIRWNKAYAGSYTNYIAFLSKEIDRMAPYSKYSVEEMYQHYKHKYVQHKIQQIEAVLKRGNGVIAECRVLFR